MEAPARMASQPIIRFGPFLLDPERKTLHREQEEIRIEPLPLALLAYLIQESPRAVPKKEIFDAVWPNSSVTDKSLYTAIRGIRAALGEDHQDLIKTVRQLPGYGFVGTARMDEGPNLPKDPLTIVHNREILSSEVDKIWLAETASQIDMLGWNLYRQWFQHEYYVDALAKRMRKPKTDVTLRVLLPSRDSLFMQAIVEDVKTPSLPEREEDNAGDFLDRHKKTVEILNSLPHDDVLRLLENEAVTCGLARFDSIMTVSLYTYPHRPQDTISLVLNMNRLGGDKLSKQCEEMFHKLSAMFDTLWRRRSTDR